MTMSYHSFGDELREPEEAMPVRRRLLHDPRWGMTLGVLVIERGPLRDEREQVTYYDWEVIAMTTLPGDRYESRIKAGTMWTGGSPEALTQLLDYFFCNCAPVETDRIWDGHRYVAQKSDVLIGQ